MIVLNLIVLLFEVLYYSCFMYFAKREGKFWKYLVLFGIITLSGLFIKTNTFISYLYLVLAMLYGMKYVVKVKTTLCDMLTMLIMLLIKLLIEFPLSMILYLITSNILIISCVVGVIKIFLIINFSDFIYKINKKITKLWNNNNFYVRYIFSCLAYVYVILSILFIMNKLL